MAESAATGLMMGAVFIFIDVSNYVDQQKVRSRTKGLQRIFTRLLIKHVCRYHIFVHMNDKKKLFFFMFENSNNLFSLVQSQTLIIPNSLTPNFSNMPEDIYLKFYVQRP